MSAAKITIIGFNNYLENLNDDLFKYLNVPTGIDKDTLVNNILLRGAEFEVLYSDPYFMQNMIGVWSNKWQRTMTKWIDALSIKYEPLENYDRIEEWTDNGSKISSDKVSKGTTSQRVSSDETSRSEDAFANDTSVSSGTGDTTNTRSAYESVSYQPHDKSESETTGTNTSASLTSAKGTTQGKQTISDADISNTDRTGFDNTADRHEGRTHGNIGVTTSQQMLEAELKISKWNIYEEITNLFLTEFCIYVY